MDNHNPLRTPDAMPPIRDDQDLHRAWSALMGPLGFDQRRLWLAFIDEDGRMNGALTQIDDLPVQVDEQFCRSLAQMCTQLLGDPTDGRSCALLLTRPGGDPVNRDDRAWACELTTAARRANVAIWPLHFANDRDLVVFAPDDVLTSR